MKMKHKVVEIIVEIAIEGAENSKIVDLIVELVDFVLHSLRKFFGTLFSPLAFPNPKPLSSYDLSPPTSSSSFPLCSLPSPDSRSHCRFGAPDFTLSPGTLYDVLGVAATTSGLEIMVAYWRLAGACHPDAVVAADRLTSSCGSTWPTRRSPTRKSAPSMIEGSSSPIGDGGRSILPDRRIPSTPADASRGRGRWTSADRIIFDLAKQPLPISILFLLKLLQLIHRCKRRKYLTVMVSLHLPLEEQLNNFDMEAVRMAAIMSKNMEAVRMSERKGIKLGLQAKSMKFCMQKKDQYVKIVAHPDHLIYSETDKLICMVVI
ncbi:hypothetical protein ZIOFF_062031 [Zingiber officinale]|uniref:Uncharacterized protein n=1 Tax=Zingiber officinale TaxID=94328 RepID=A0A8J5KIV9_ZINOF|nr:hypothetical protein ZIOFF_062031 [Zingiber officinale]